MRGSLAPFLLLPSLLLGGCFLDRTGLLQGEECPTGYVDLDGEASNGCECQLDPMGERCNSADDDCDGTIDEMVTDPCIAGAGECGRGTRRCVAGGEWSACVPDVSPTDEACDGTLDEDCDGSVDEGCTCVPGNMRECGETMGECVAGNQVCEASEVWGACVGAVGPAEEVCNTLDDDCDGTIDEWSAPCGSDVGACMQGIQQCAGGSPGACMGEVTATPEVCDSRIDEDCDGTVDEATCNCMTGATRACTVSGTGCGGTQTCTAGAWSTCVMTSVAEVCNGIDDDCDGEVDSAAVCDTASGCSWLTDGMGGAYLRCTTAVSWDVARANCMAFGYDLVVVDSDAEQMFLNDNDGGSDWWIGMRDRPGGGRNYEWVYPATGTYTKWRGGRPDADNECVWNDTSRGSSAGEWENAACTSTKPYFCEVPP